MTGIKIAVGMAALGMVGEGAIAANLVPVDNATPFHIAATAMVLAALALVGFVVRGLFKAQEKHADAAREQASANMALAAEIREGNTQRGEMLGRMNNNPCLMDRPEFIATLIASVREGIRGDRQAEHGTNLP